MFELEQIRLGLSAYDEKLQEMGEMCIRDRDHIR